MSYLMAGVGDGLEDGSRDTGQYWSTTGIKSVRPRIVSDVGVQLW